MEEFMKPWMEKCNPQLIIRFWRSKGSPGRLTTTEYGVRIVNILTPFGELRIRWNEMIVQ